MGATATLRVFAQWALQHPLLAGKALGEARVRVRLVLGADEVDGEADGHDVPDLRRCSRQCGESTQRCTAMPGAPVGVWRARQINGLPSQRMVCFQGTCVRAVAGARERRWLRMRVWCVCV